MFHLTTQPQKESGHSEAVPGYPQLALALENDHSIV